MSFEKDDILVFMMTVVGVCRWYYFNQIYTAKKRMSVESSVMGIWLRMRCYRTIDGGALFLSGHIS